MVDNILLINKWKLDTFAFCAYIFLTDTVGWKLPLAGVGAPTFKVDSKTIVFIVFRTDFSYFCMEVLLPNVE